MTFAGLRMAGRLANLWLLVEAIALLALTWAGVRAVALRNLRRILSAGTRANRNPRRGSLERVRWSVTAAARRCPSSVNCLTQALVVEAMLRRRGYNPTLHLGVRRREDGSAPMQAHAWVECSGMVIIGELENLTDYAVLQPPGSL